MMNKSLRGSAPESSSKTFYGFRGMGRSDRRRAGKCGFGTVLRQLRDAKKRAAVSGGF
jgi:hypothetical protein